MRYLQVAGRDELLLNRGCAYVDDRDRCRTASRWRLQPTDSEG